jgi:hypothetical protein
MLANGIVLGEGIGSTCRNRSHLGSANGEEGENQVRVSEPMGQGRTTNWSNEGEGKRQEQGSGAGNTLAHNLLIALTMEEVSTFETSAYFYKTTQRSCHLYTHRSENPKYCASYWLQTIV